MSDEPDDSGEADDQTVSRDRSLRARWIRLRAVLTHTTPAKLLLLGYLSYIALGWILLSLPFAQATAVPAIDNLFIATSAVSTTGLVSVDPGSSYTFFGQLVILLLIQLGGLGYMTVGSFVVLTAQDRMSRLRREATKNAFNLPDDVKPKLFIRSVVRFTLICEVIGAAVLYVMFRQQGVEDALWSAIFHSISAFCTAGFSLFSNSFESFGAHAGITLTISALSILGAMGFLIVVDASRTLSGRSPHLGFTSKVIIRLTLLFLLIGTVILMVVEPGIAALPANERLLTAFFQVMTASTTVGFNTYPISALSHSVLIVFFFLMVIGASPAGTGGGLKTTSFAALIGLVRSTLKGRDRIRFFKREIPLQRLQDATAGLAYYLVLLAGAMFLLFLTEADAAFDVVMFEVISALGTVGLSMGLTGELSDLGKLIVVGLMTAGRVGILTFGIALATHDESREEEQDNDLVL
ncbi:potassium transporter TrkG [uncultured Roseobacter sp.]|uniref:TrkH family potassium uptake protein n=1 Tax=uncultured Roseobacter sp. TaxID=114847 RepID=UPI002614A1C7|nr:potassium transporter TrkG [uncultured Roseobacter sp.]